MSSCVCCRRPRRRWSTPTARASFTETSSQTTVIVDDSDRPVIVDFGLARVPGDHSQAGNGSPLGTPSYMAPEQVAWRPGSHRAAHGRLCTGRQCCSRCSREPFPFAGRVPTRSTARSGAILPRPRAACEPGLPPEVDAICLKCLEKAPAEPLPECGGARTGPVALPQRRTGLRSAALRALSSRKTHGEGGPV